MELSPDVQTRVVNVRGRLGRVGGQPWPGDVSIGSVDTGGKSVSAAVSSNGSFKAEYRFTSEAGLWGECSPTLHTLAATLKNGERREVTFGFRQIGARGRQLTINAQKLFLRGALDCAIFPKSGHPPTDVPSWKRVFGFIKARGLNHGRYHSWCPPEAAFVAADEMGVYLQVEVASWPNQSTTLGDGKPVDAWIDAETARILRAYGNHP